MHLFCHPDSRPLGENLARDEQEGDVSSQVVEKAAEAGTHLLAAVGAGEEDVRSIATGGAKKGNCSRYSACFYECAQYCELIFATGCGACHKSACL